MSECAQMRGLVNVGCLRISGMQMNAQGSRAGQSLRSRMILLLNAAAAFFCDRVGRGRVCRNRHFGEYQTTNKPDAEARCNLPQRAQVLHVQEEVYRRADNVDNRNQYTQ